MCTQLVTCWLFITSNTSNLLTFIYYIYNLVNGLWLNFRLFETIFLRCALILGQWSEEVGGREGWEGTQATIQHCLELGKPPKIGRRHPYHTTRP